jgi:hypothetical protein
VPFRILSSSHSRHLGYLSCLPIEITGGKHHFSPGETRQEGRGPRCQSTDKAKRSTKKANAKHRGAAEPSRTPPTSIFYGLLRRRGGRGPLASSSLRLRETYYITRCCCSWPLLLLPVLQGASRTQTIPALDAMAEVFSDDLNLKIGDLLSRTQNSPRV